MAPYPDASLAGAKASPENPSTPSDPRWRRLTVAAIALWIVAILGAWIVSRFTNQLPVSDVVGFVREAGRTWSELAERGIGSLFDTSNGFRPFGTSLLGYPFGFGTDFRAYYWRTVAIPASFGLAATLLAAMAAGARFRSVEAWLLAVVGGALPMWWCFDDVRDRDAQWGTANGFSAGLIALATALLLYGWKRGRAAPMVASFAVAAATPFFQEIGFALMVGHALLAALLLVWTRLVDRQPISPRVSLMLGACLPVLAGVWLLCSSALYVEAGDPSRWGMSFAELHAFERAAPIGSVMLDFARSILVHGLGIPALILVIGGSAATWNQRRKPWWIIALLGAGILGFLTDVAFAWTGSHLQRFGAFMPAISVLWILCCPAVLELWRLHAAMRWVAIASAGILAASVCVPGFARVLHPVTGYTTVLDASIGSTIDEVRASLEKLGSPTDGAVVFQSRITPFLEHEAAARQAILGPFEPGSAEDRDLLRRDAQLHEPRLMSQMLPHVQPHEAAFSDYILTLGADQERFLVGTLWRSVRSVAEVLRTPRARAMTEVVADNPYVTVLRPVDRIGLERLLVARLQDEGLLDPAQIGPVEPTQSPPIATYPTGDVLVAARAEWRPGGLRVETVWSGTRSERRNLVMRIVLLGQDGKPAIWMPSPTLVPPPASVDGSIYRRTIVNNFQRRGIRVRTTGAAIVLYSGEQAAGLRPDSKDLVEGTNLVRIPLTGTE